MDENKEQEPADDTQQLLNTPLTDEPIEPAAETIALGVGKVGGRRENGSVIFLLLSLRQIHRLFNEMILQKLKLCQMTRSILYSKRLFRQQQKQSSMQW
jgi:hypothetical protein